MMLSKPQFEAVVARARLAPSVHNAQPARWRQIGDVIEVAADRGISLPEADPAGTHVGLSCGAAVEATVLALSAFGVSCNVLDLWDAHDLHSWSGHRMAARLTCIKGAQVDPLAVQLEARFTWREAYAADVLRLYGWSRRDAVFVMDAPMRSWIAGLNDAASLGILQRKAFRRELLSWMRLDAEHPRYTVDGLSREALHIDANIARKVAQGFGPLWPFLNMIGKTGSMTAEADVTMTAPLIACFHRPHDESAMQSGRAYLRLCLEAAQLGLAGWPMAALTDDAAVGAQIAEQLAIGPERKLVQVLRFGVPTGLQTARARRSVAGLIDG